MFRQQLMTMLRESVHNAVDYDDETWGRQLATILETYSLFLRAHYGGRPKWAPHLKKVHLQLRRANEVKNENA